MIEEQRKTIRQNYKEFNGGDPYKYFDWIQVLTPIEKNVWGDIRVLNLPFYPQFPVGQYFLDFADPIKMIGIEVDGQRWHLDFEADNKRQKEIESLGWTIYRIQGRDTFDKKDEEDTYSESYKFFFNLYHELYARPKNDFIHISKVKIL